MPQQSLGNRVERLEIRMTALERLPALVDDLAVRVGRLESQVSQLREEMHAEFSAIRTEIRAGDEQVGLALREEIRAGDEETRRVLREEIRAGDEETRRFMRMLHEEVIERIATLGEGLGADTKKRGRGRRPGRS